MPATEPLRLLPTEFRAWDQLASELPQLHRSLRLRSRVAELPVLDGNRVPAAHLHRATAVLAMLSHAYWYVGTQAPSDLPAALRIPWKQTRDRLARKGEVLSYIDLIVYNWRLHDSSQARVVENMSLLIPTVDNQEEHTFYLTQAEILERSAPMIRAMASIDDAIDGSCESTVERALFDIAEAMTWIVRDALPKISPHRLSQTYMDPVVWAKSVAPFAVPFTEGLLGPSGTSSPIFNALDRLFDRPSNKTFLGSEIHNLSAHYPSRWRHFLAALDRLKLRDFVEASGNRSLQAAYADAHYLYTGSNGFLGRHRMKVYGFLELAFKVGRSVTIGGFQGVFKDRTWDQVDSELRAAQQERGDETKLGTQDAQVTVKACPSADGLHTLCVTSERPSPLPGSRCEILPKNSQLLVKQTARALGVTLDDLVNLTSEWQAQTRPSISGRKQLTVAEVLQFGEIRTVSARVAEALLSLTQDAALRREIEGGFAQDRELWQLLVELTNRGWQPAVHFRRRHGSEWLTRLVPPLACRTYSVGHSARSDSPSQRVTETELTISPLQVNRSTKPKPVAAGGCPMSKLGTASDMLTRKGHTPVTVPYRVTPSPVFCMPKDPHVPLVMFAGGSGVAPFRGFLRARATHPEAADAWLFVSLKSRSDLGCIEELLPLVRAGKLHLFVAVTRQDVAVDVTLDGQLQVKPGARRRLPALLSEPELARALKHVVTHRDAGGLSGEVFICGRTTFAESIIAALEDALSEPTDGCRTDDSSGSQSRIAQLIGEGRLRQEVYAEQRPISGAGRALYASEVARHNCNEYGYWMVVDDYVYDVGEFFDLHPGGTHVLSLYAGMDASEGFHRAHQGRHEPTAMLGRYKIGRLARPEFLTCASSAPVLREIYTCWMSALQVCVEMENALRADHSLQLKTAIGKTQDTTPNPYKLSRLLESHERFLNSYVTPWLTSILPGLVENTLQSTSGEELSIFTPGDTWLHRVHQLEAGVARASRQYENGEIQDCGQSLAGSLTQRDHRLLIQLKPHLQAGTHYLESLEGPQSPEQLTALIPGLNAMFQVFPEYLDDIERQWRIATPDDASLLSSDGSPSSGTRRKRLRPLYSNNMWSLAEDQERGVTILGRSSEPVKSLEQVESQNAELLQALCCSRREFGLVVDVRSAQLRNDPHFEDAMARLRDGVTTYFARTAVLVQSSLGKLQVERLERNERRTSLTTSSESSAMLFAAGLKAAQPSTTGTH